MGRFYCFSNGAGAFTGQGCKAGARKQECTRACVHALAATWTAQLVTFCLSPSVVPSALILEPSLHCTQHGQDPGVQK